ncbi:MAG: hypothetical protein HQK68_12685 [Desulfamplus sp.]|nr:hypothetical protein [Desulfamplus sp.]
MNQADDRFSEKREDGSRGFIKIIGVLLSIIAGLITIVATSGDSGDSTATPETPPAGIAIITPSNNQTFVEGDFVSFVGKISDAVATETYTYAWNSSLDGAIGTTANFNSNTLSAGTHKITLTLSDTQANILDADSITITVGSPTTPSSAEPIVSITAPSGVLAFNVGENITFTGSAKDSKGADIADSSLLWSSNIDGVMGNGGTITSAILSKGQHTITLTAKDTKGNSGSAFIILTVGGSSSSPVVKITTPAVADSTNPTTPPNNYDVKAGDVINFTGSATDYDGSTIDSQNLEWLSSKNGKLFTGNHFALNTRSVEALDYEPLKEGEHTIYLKATGQSGTAQASITINVINTNPTAQIVNPPETCPTTNTLCKTFAPGEFISFQGVASDSEDGNLSGASLEWYSQIDGLLGTGESLNIKTDSVDTLGNAPMANGEHIITLEAKDDWGASGIASVIINIGTNTPPVPKITYYNSDSEPATLTMAASGFMTFYGSAQDAEEGALKSDLLEWYVSNQEEKLVSQEVAGSGGLTSSVRVDLSKFAANSINSITLVATDSRGSTGVTSRNITIDANKVQATISK